MNPEKIDKRKPTAKKEISPTTNPTEKKAEEKAKSEAREIVVPGQIVAKGLDNLPGDGTIREGQNIIAIRFGLLNSVGRLMKVIPLTGTYFPKKEDIVIGEITEITQAGWVVSFGLRASGFLTLAEGSREYVPKNADLTKYHNFGDLVAVQVVAVKPKGIDLSIKGPGLRKLDGGLVVKINPNKVPRVIGRQGSMVNLIKQETNCNIVVGQNGLIWVNGRNAESELLARDAIKKVEAFSHIPDLTEKIKEFLDSRK